MCSGSVSHEVAKLSARAAVSLRCTWAGGSVSKLTSMAVGTGLGALHVLASHRASDARDRDTHRDRLTDQDGSPGIFYNLTLGVTDHHF